MTIRASIMKIVQQDNLNFLLTNYVPRRALTRFVGWVSRIEHPLVRDISLRSWKFFADIDLSDAKHTSFRSMHECFTRELRPGARPIDMNPSIIVSPCDAIVGASGIVNDGQLLQVKGLTYNLEDLLGDRAHAADFRDGRYVTLRLTSSMYHRFHAPHDCRVESVRHFPGDVWNVNPITLRRVQRLFCKNERAVIQTRLAGTGHIMTLVPVAAILVAGIRLRFLNAPLRTACADRQALACDAIFHKGEEIGWFEHGSTIIVLLPDGFTLCDAVREGAHIRVGQPLSRLPI